jgi:hypothetical protein
LTELYRIIEALMDATFRADQELKPLLATLEYKARKCKECIERRLAVTKKKYSKKLNIFEYF